MNLSFKNRIALYYMIATAVIMAVVFGFVFFMVQSTVYRNLDHDLAYEAEKHTHEISIVGDSIQFINMAEWEEHEHREIQVNPVFIQVTDREGRLMDRSPNLKDNQLALKKESHYEGHFDSELNGRDIRQVQIPIEEGGQVRGYILAAMSSESARSVITKLRDVLFVSWWFILLGLYFVSAYLAGRSIVPIREITATTDRITKNNLNERVRLPANRDELYALSAGFNDLLERIERAIERERQFTSDASHELRTPLAALRGTLEVLIRKGRSQEEYESKIQYSLSEIDRMSAIIDQLLLLARMDSGPRSHSSQKLPLSALVQDVLSRYGTPLADKGLVVDLDLDLGGAFPVPQYHANLILDNLLNNAIKYSQPGTRIAIRSATEEGRLVCQVEDQGMGIRAEDMEQVFERFYRSDALGHKGIPGNGLGLAIVRKAADAIGAELSISSRLGEGTTVTIRF